jgi:hypothetical protein
MWSYTPGLLQSYKSDLDDEIDEWFWLRYVTDRGCITIGCGTWFDAMVYDIWLWIVWCVARELLMVILVYGWGTC